jgi:hypothetical protein
VARREREILEHAVRAITDQAANADDLVNGFTPVTGDLPTLGSGRSPYLVRM